MPHYLVETFLARGDAGERTAREQRARLASAGTEVHFDRAIHVPEDEICFFVFSAASRREVVLLAQRASLEPLRVIEAVPSGEEQHNA